MPPRKTTLRVLPSVPPEIASTRPPGPSPQSPIPEPLLKAPPKLPTQIGMLVDGHRLILTARDEIVLCCGKASITLRRNGRIVVRGTYVETSSEGTNRIKGGSVQIN